MKANDKLKIVLFAFASFSVLFYVGTFWFASVNYKDAGTFGDAFGFANALFSGGALVMLIYAVILQRDELAVIKEERDDTRKLLSGQENINALQEEALRKQIFEQSFNAMLKAALDEKDRLSTQREMGGGGIFTLIGIAARRALQSLEKYPYRLIEPTPSRPTINEVSFFIHLLQNLNESLEKSPLSAEAIMLKRNLIYALVDENVAICIAAQVVSEKLRKNDESLISDFAQQLNVFEVIPEPARQHFIKFMDKSTR